MKKLFLLPIITLLACFACCGPVKKDAGIKADRGIFIVQSIESADDSSKVLSKYLITSDTMAFENSIPNQQQGHNPFLFYLADTSGKYKIGDTLWLGLKPQSEY